MKERFTERLESILFSEKADRITSAVCCIVSVAVLILVIVGFATFR